MLAPSRPTDESWPMADETHATFRSGYTEISDGDDIIKDTNTAHAMQPPLMGPLLSPSRLAQHQRYPSIEPCTPVRSMGIHETAKFSDSDESDTDQLIENVASTPFIEERRQWRTNMLRAVVVVGIVCILSTLNFLIWASSQEITLDIVGFQEFQLIENILYCDITFEVINPNIQSIKINPFQLNFRLYSNESEEIYLGHMDSSDYASLASATSDYELKEVPVTFFLDDSADVEQIKRILLMKDFELCASGRISYQMMLSRVTKKIAHVSRYSQQQRIIIDTTTGEKQGGTLGQKPVLPCM